MHRTIERLFLDHPAKVGETYGEHFRFALSFGITLIGAGFAAITHAVLPFLFETTASTLIKRLHQRIVSRSVSAAPSAAGAEAVPGAAWYPHI